jgi:hypothetical protein
VSRLQRILWAPDGTRNAVTTADESATQSTGKSLFKMMISRSKIPSKFGRKWASLVQREYWMIGHDPAARLKCKAFRQGGKSNEFTEELAQKIFH